MSSLARSRAAERGARTRVSRNATRGYDGPALRRRELAVSAEERRGGLPPRNQARRLATHVDSLSGGLMVPTEDEDVWGVYGLAEVEADQLLLFHTLEGGETARSAVVSESYPIGVGYYLVGITNTRPTLRTPSESPAPPPPPSPRRQPSSPPRRPLLPLWRPARCARRAARQSARRSARRISLLPALYRD